MILFIRKIPNDTRYSDIVSFVEPALKGGILRRSGHIVHIEIIGYRDHRLHTSEFHALVEIEPDSVGLRAVGLLKGRRLHHHLVVIRQYFERNWHNDRRQDFETPPPGGVERRMADRRRGKDLERILDLSGYFSNAGDFVRKSL